MTHDLDARLNDLGGLVDGWLREVVGQSVSPAAERFGAMLEYHFGWRDTDQQTLDKPAPAGKRLRPALALLVSEGVCGDISPARDVAVAVELIHNFSLVHDDIQDRSEMRRHRHTLWTVWGLAQGINAGDALFALAQSVILRQRTALAARLAADLNATALLLAEGQYLDVAMQRGHEPSTLATYEAMITRKTGVLFASTCRLGALAAGASDARAAAFSGFGLELGIAFQEQDDLLGVWGRADETGKPDAADIVERKRGLPAAMALGTSDAPAWLGEFYAGQSQPTITEVERVREHFLSLGLREQITARVKDRHARALACLEAAAPAEPARSYLRTICEALVARRA
jgi:geranylgeranyl diphosphate synthase, type I